MAVVDPTGPAGARPFSVMVVQWLAYLQGAITLLGGILLLAFRDHERVRTDFTSLEINAAAIWIIVIALITFWVATSYARGSRIALVVVACVTLLNLGSSLWWLFIHPVHVLAGLVNIAISAIIFYFAVLAPDTREYFDRYGH